MKILITDDLDKTKLKDRFDAFVIFVIDKEDETVLVYKNAVGDVYKKEFPLNSLIDLVSEQEKEYLKKHNQ